MTKTTETQKTADSQILDLLGDFCKDMQARIPETRVIDDYFATIRGFDIEIVRQSFREWRHDYAFKFPSPNELLHKLMEVSTREERKGAPKTLTDIFGNRVKVETPLANRLRQIIKLQTCEPKKKYGQTLFTGVITGREAMEMVWDAEGNYGPVHKNPLPERKTARECIEDAGIDVSMAKKAWFKLEHKRNEYEREELRKLCGCLLRHGYYFVKATSEKIIVGKLDDDAWRDSVEILAQMAEGM